MAVAEILCEEDRNRLLRRADWRFLLPNPQPARSICFAKGSLSRAVKLISGDLVDHQAGLGDDCDLAVAIDPDYATLRAAWVRLRPRGSIYSEWYSPVIGGPEGIRRRLAAAGFHDVTCYWCWPWPFLARSRYWLPLEASGAVRYFLNSRPPARTVSHRIGIAFLRIVWHLCVRFGLARPLCAIAGKPASSRARREPAGAGSLLSVASRPLNASSMIDNLLGPLGIQWESWSPGPLPDRLSTLILTGGPRSISKVVMLVFAEPNHQPWLAIKLPRVPEAGAGLCREATVLRALQSRRPSGLRGAPQVLFCRQHAGLLTVGETALTGRHLSTILCRRNYRHLALKATDWLLDLAEHSEPRPPATWWDRLIEPVLRDFSQSFGPILDRGMVRETGEILAQLGPLPLVCEQRDFGPWNILLTGEGELAVLDWESSELEGLPALDLIYFLSYLAFFLDGAIDSGRFPESYRKMLDPSTLTGGVLREAVGRYANRTGLEPSNLRALRLLVWLLHSRSEYQHFRSDVGGKPEPELLRRSRFVSLWEEEVRAGPESL
jgi:hypothetical protein